MRAVLFFISFLFLAHFAFASPPQNSQDDNQEQMTSSNSASSEDMSYIQSLIAKINSLMSEVRNYFRNPGAPNEPLPLPPVVQYPVMKPTPIQVKYPISQPPVGFDPALPGPLPPESIPTQTLPVDPKAQKMAACFSNIQEVLDNRKRKELISQGGSF